MPARPQHPDRATTLQGTQLFEPLEGLEDPLAPGGELQQEPATVSIKAHMTQPGPRRSGSIRLGPRAARGTPRAFALDSLHVGDRAPRKIERPASRIAHNLHHVG